MTSAIVAEDPTKTGFELQRRFRASPERVFSRMGLGRLQEAGLIIAESNGRYSFRHASIRDAAYETLLIPRRKKLHERIAKTMQR